MLRIQYHSQFKKDYKLAKKRGLNIGLLTEVINILIKEEPLPKNYKDHQLTNYPAPYNNVRECHIQPDWLLVYHIDANELVLDLIRTGTHSDLF